LAAQLALPLVELEWSNVPLARTVKSLSELSRVPITIDLYSLWLFGVEPQTPISLHLQACSVETALQKAAEGCGLRVHIDGNQVVITAPGDFCETLQERRYTVVDLTGKEREATAALAEMLQKLVLPNSWKTSGGEGKVEVVEPGVLRVVQSGLGHTLAVDFCERLRLARGLPLRSREAKRQPSLATRWDTARSLLARPITVNFHEPTPLKEILDFLGETGGAKFFVDHAALAAAETSDNVETTLTVEKRNLEAVLAGLLLPLGLTFQTFGPDTIQITTSEAAEEQMYVEFYRVDAWLSRGASPSRLIEQLKRSVAPASWSDVGGGAEICFDASSRSLIVLQSQPAHGIIQKLLSRLPKL